MTDGERVRLAARLEALAGVRADRLEHRQPRRRPRCGEGRGCCRRAPRPRRASSPQTARPPPACSRRRTRRGARRATVRPARAGRSSSRSSRGASAAASGGRAGRASRSVETLLEPLEERIAARAASPGGGELDRERQAVERAQISATAARSPVRSKSAPRRRARGRRRASTALVELRGRDRVARALRRARRGSRLVDEHFQPGRGGEQPRAGRGVEHVLEVVEDEQRFADRARPSSTTCSRRAEAERAGDRREDERGSASAASVDEDTPSGLVVLRRLRARAGLACTARAASVTTRTSAQRSSAASASSRPRPISGVGGAGTPGSAGPAEAARGSGPGRGSPARAPATPPARLEPELLHSVARARYASSASACRPERYSASMTCPRRRSRIGCSLPIASSSARPRLAAEPEIGIDPPLERAQPQPLEAFHLRPSEHLVAKSARAGPRNRASASQSTAPASPAAPASSRPRPRPSRPLEAIRVVASGLDPNPVPARTSSPRRPRPAPWAAATHTPAPSSPPGPGGRSPQSSSTSRPVGTTSLARSNSRANTAPPASTGPRAIS